MHAVKYLYLLNQLTFNLSLNLCLIKLSKAMKLEMTKKNKTNRERVKMLMKESASSMQEAMDN